MTAPKGPRYGDIPQERRCSLADPRLDVRFETSGAHAGVPLEDFEKTLARVQRAVRLMVRHLAGAPAKSGRPPEWLRFESNLRLLGTAPGSLVVELEQSAGPDQQRELTGYGQTAIDSILDWSPDDEALLPADVADELRAIASEVSSEISAVHVHDADRIRQVRIGRSDCDPRTQKGIRDTAIVEGQLLEVNWDKGTAQLHRYGDRYVRLRFAADLGEEMRGLATRYVRVEGEGRFDQDGDWTSVAVKHISATRSWQASGNLDEFLKRATTNVFERGSLTCASEPFDVQDFIQTIHEARDV